MHIRKNSLGFLWITSSLGLPPYCCLNCLNTAIRYVNLAALTLKKALPLDPGLVFTFVSMSRALREEHPLWLALRADPAHPGEQAMGKCWGVSEGSEGPWWIFLPEVYLSASQIHYTFPIDTIRKSRPHGRNVVVLVQLLGFSPRFLGGRSRMLFKHIGVVFWPVSHSSW